MTDKTQYSFFPVKSAFWNTIQFDSTLAIQNSASFVKVHIIEIFWPKRINTASDGSLKKFLKR